jgi:hypothetical protein
MPPREHRSERTVSTYCYQCVAGPDLLTVRVQDGIATEINPNFAAAKVHPAGGKVCVKAYGLVQKAYLAAETAASHSDVEAARQRGRETERCCGRSNHSSWPANSHLDLTYVKAESVFLLFLTIANRNWRM